MEATSAITIHLPTSCARWRGSADARWRRSGRAGPRPRSRRRPPGRSPTCDQQHQQHREHRQRAQRRVADQVVGMGAPAQVATTELRRIQERREARPSPADEAPDQAKQQQRQHRVAEAEVPFHDAARGRSRLADHAAASAQWNRRVGQVPDPRAGVLASQPRALGWARDGGGHRRHEAAGGAD